MTEDLRQLRRRASDRRAAILEAVAVAAERLIQDPSLDQHLPQIMERMGQATGVSRCYFFENHVGDDGVLLASQRYEWAAPGIEPQMGNPDVQGLPWLTGGMGRWMEVMIHGSPVCGHVKDFPRSEQEILGSQGIQSIVAVPVMVGGDWHGFIGVDECTCEREWAADELDALKAAAGIVGAAIERRVAEEALRASEEQYRRLVETMSDGLAELDADMRITFVNSRLCAMVGFDRDEMIGRRVAGLPSIADREVLRDQLEKRPEGKDEPYELRLVHREGRQVIARLSPRAIYDRAGRFKGSITVVSDITDRKHMEEELQRELAERSRAERELKEHREHLEELVQARTAELAEANERLRREIIEREQAQQELEAQRTLSMRSDRLRSLGEMAAGMAHELNQPLQGVRGLAQQLAIAVDRGWEETKETVQDTAREIVAQVDRMTHVIEHVRMFARDAGKPDLSPVDANEVVRSSVDMIHAQCQAHGIDIRTELAEALPAVLANPFSLEEVLVNLLLNARDAVEEQNDQRPARTPRVLLRTGLRPADADTCVAIEVIDSGVGIPQDVLDKVFDPFFTTKEPRRGTGLGLSISRSIVEMFGGTIDLESTPGRETRVTILLPTCNAKEWQP